MVLIDGGDLACGELLILIHKQVRALPAGTVVGIATSDPAASIDLPAWCHLTGHAYLGPASGDAGARHLVELAGPRPPTDPDRPWHRKPENHPVHNSTLSAEATQ